MRRILIVVAYDGTNYHGWQYQDNGATIEGELNKALNALTGEKIEVIGASRTDAGVHAYGNRAVFDTESTIPADRFAEALNTYLPDDIRVVTSCEVDGDWHPRKVNTHKTYEYRIDCGRIANPLITRYAWHIPQLLNVDAMAEAARVLIGEHDFSSFCSVKTQALTTVRTIYNIEVIDVTSDSHPFNALASGTGQDGGVHQEVLIRVTGNGFLYNMVRIIAGTLKEVGIGKLSVSDVEAILEAKDRTKGAVTAPPEGLTLYRIEDVDK